MSKPIRIIVWNEFVHERQRDEVAAIYPDGMHIVIAAALRDQLGSRASSLHGHVGPTRTRARSSGDRWHRCAFLVGPHGTRSGE